MEGKVRKFGLKLRIKKTKVATHIYGGGRFPKIVKKKLFQLNFFEKKKNRKASFVLRKWAYFQFKMGWFKVKTVTNLGPQKICTYLPLAIMATFLGIMFGLTGTTHVQEFSNVPGKFNLSNFLVSP